MTKNIWNIKAVGHNQSSVYMKIYSFEEKSKINYLRLHVKKLEKKSRVNSKEK